MSTFKIYKHEERGPRGGIRLVGYVLLDTRNNIAVRRAMRRGQLTHLRDHLNSEAANRPTLIHATPAQAAAPYVDWRINCKNEEHDE